MSIRLARPVDSRLPKGVRVFLLVVALCPVILALNSWQSELHPGNWWGMGYGIAAAVMLLGVTLYSARRRLPRYGPARARHWLQFHLYGGVLFLLFVLMHTGFHLPAGFVGWTLWLLSLWMLASGIAGVLIQKWIPRVLTSGLSTEVHYDRIAELVDAVREKAIALVEDAEGPVHEFFNEKLAERLTAPQPRWIYFVDISGGVRSEAREFDYLRMLLSGEERNRLDQLELLTRTKFELDAHYTLQRVLRYWLFGHVPFTLALLVLAAFHVFSVLYY